MVDVVEYARAAYPTEDDFVVMGDFNADCSYFDEDGPSPLKAYEYTWVIGNEWDTTTKATDCTYDRIVITDVSEVAEAGVFRFDLEYGLNETATQEVSDHYPVWVEVIY